MPYITPFDNCGTIKTEVVMFALDRFGGPIRDRPRASAYSDLVNLHSNATEQQIFGLIVDIRWHERHNLDRATRLVALRWPSLLASILEGEIYEEEAA